MVDETTRLVDHKEVEEHVVVVAVVFVIESMVVVLGVRVPGNDLAGRLVGRSAVHNEREGQPSTASGGD